jgi:sugar lactone lactonase YvrE
MYRVSRNVLPKTYGAVVRGSDAITFQNMKVFSQTRLAFDHSVHDEDSGAAVRAQFFTRFVVNAGTKAPAPQTLPSSLVAAGASVTQLATGFSNASGLTASPAGDVFFTDAVNHTIYRWNDATKKADVVAEIAAAQPMSVTFVSPSTLLAVANEHAVYQVDARGGSATAVTETPDPLPNTVLLLPVGLHNQLSQLNDLLDHRGYVYRQGSNTAIVRVVDDEHRGYFYAPGTTSAIVAGGTWRPNLQSSQFAPFAPGDRHYLTSEDDGRTYIGTLGTNGKLTTTVFAERGGTSVVTDAAGHVFIASGQIEVYDRAGKQIGTIEVPERPGSLVFGGPDKRTLFIGARGSLYAVQMRAAGN